MKTPQLCIVLYVLCAHSVLCGSPFAVHAQDKFRDARQRMVRECIEREGIKDPRVIEAMRTVPRHEFVRSGLQKEAYHDTALPIGNQQTISPPFVVA